jgi:hypothetical protein
MDGNNGGLSPLYLDFYNSIKGGQVQNLTLQAWVPAFAGMEMGNTPP